VAARAERVSAAAGRSEVSQKNSRAPQRVRNELRFRHLTVASKIQVAGVFWRIVFTGADLAGFHSPSFDDHIKLFFPPEPGCDFALPQMGEEGIIWPEGVRPAARDYTPLAFNGIDSLTLDFYMHDDGVASGWAAAAKPGDRIAMGGPRGSCIMPADYACQVYVCDETGLPAFKRRYAGLQAQRVHLMAFTDAATGHSYLGEMEGVTAHWLGSNRMATTTPAQLTAELAAIDFTGGDYFVWLTGEGNAVKQLSDYFTQQRGVHTDFIRAVAYWHQKSPEK